MANAENNIKVVQVTSGQNLDMIVIREMQAMTETPPEGVQPAVDENSRRMTLTKIDASGKRLVTRIDFD